MLIMFTWAKHDLVSQISNTFEDPGGQNQMQAFFPPSQCGTCRLKAGVVGTSAYNRWSPDGSVSFFFFNSTHPLSFGCPGIMNAAPDLHVVLPCTNLTWVEFLRLKIMYSRVWNPSTSIPFDLPSSLGKWSVGALMSHSKWGISNCPNEVGVKLGRKKGGQEKKAINYETINSTSKEPLVYFLTNSFFFLCIFLSH